MAGKIPPKVVVVGSCVTDLTSNAPRLPQPGETLLGHKFTMGFGGKGANQCVAATRLGATTAMVAMVGDDSFGQNYLLNFKEYGVDTSLVGVTKEAATGVASIVVDDAGENCIVTVAGANMKMTSSAVEQAECVIQGASVMVCQAEITPAATLTALRLAQKHKVKTVMNAAPVGLSLDPAIIELSDIFCVNESEAEARTNIKVKTVKDAEQAAEALLQRGSSSVIITLGGEGAVYSTAAGHTHITTEKVTPVDTTVRLGEVGYKTPLCPEELCEWSPPTREMRNPYEGGQGPCIWIANAGEKNCWRRYRTPSLEEADLGAGDAFVGALAYYLAYHPQLTMAEMLQRSCQVATRSVLSPGTQSSYPTRDQLPAHLFS